MGQVTLEEIIQRVQQKKNDYARYNFARLQEEAFATFFDLAQEAMAPDYLYLVAVAVPKVFFGIESKLYVVHLKSHQLQLVCTSEDGLISQDHLLRRPSVVYPSLDVLEGLLHHAGDNPPGSSPHREVSWWIFPIRGNRALTQWVTFSGYKGVLGLFAATSSPHQPSSPSQDLSREDLFFLEKFTNRIGYNLHQKLLIRQNLDHLKFINQLVADIEHNVISPNLYYKLFLRRLGKLIETSRGIHERLSQLLHTSYTPEQIRSICDQLSSFNNTIAEAVEGFERHYNHTSLFLETLFRKEHFAKGTYVLRKQSCNFKHEIIESLIERYLPMLEKKGIHVHRTAGDIPDEEIKLFVDKGLISQVFDNLLSNALKYTEEVEDAEGHRTKRISLDHTILRNYFGEGMHGIRFSLFSTGHPLSEEEAKRVFEEGYRATHSTPEKGAAPPSGIGHGLYFVKSVIEIHGGAVGCEPEANGNTFYFILPFNEKPEELE